MLRLKAIVFYSIPAAGWDSEKSCEILFIKKKDSLSSAEKSKSQWPNRS